MLKMKIFGSINGQDLTKDSMPIEKYEETKVNNVSKIVLVMGDWDKNPTED